MISRPRRSCARGSCRRRPVAVPGSPRKAAACFQAIGDLPEDEREAFDLVRIQGMTQVEAAEVLGVSIKTVQRRLNRALLILTEELDDLRPAGEPPRQP
jgi:DNA-directed RNA polymerase specialized sigma24 family protein